mmetsp:Transcript_18337/g.23299  ORF Transcript_18337/g.23299 Transcript_18337/m.23299 type:complete len:140 (+) Transcript_18337:158-577(+)
MRMDQTGGLLQRSNGSGSFSLAYFHSTPKGKQKERSKVISESGVKLQFRSNQFDLPLMLSYEKNIKRLQMQHQLLHQEGKMQVDIKYKKESRPVRLSMQGSYDLDRHHYDGQGCLWRCGTFSHHSMPGQQLLYMVLELV